MKKILPKKIIVSALVFFVSVFFSVSLAEFSVNSLIVEPYDPEGSIRYAPVDFAGDETFTAPDGIIYHALSETGNEDSTKSNHAATVRDRLLEADGPNDPIEDIFALSASDYLNDYVRTSSPSETATLPAEYGNDIKVVNHSWIGGYGDEELELDAVRRMDYMIRREDVIMTSGAVSGAPLTWSSRNAIAVRGSQSFNPDAAVGTRRHADIWGPLRNDSEQAASYGTPGVAGYSAALLSEADAQGWSNGQNGMRHEVIKSLLMTGADKTAFTSSGFTSWEADLSNNLDSKNGAGRPDYDASKRILLSGRQEMAEVDNDSNITSPNVTQNHSGWWYEDNISANGAQALVLDLTDLYLTDLTATLAWDVTQEETAQGLFDTLNTTDDGEIFAHLTLEFLEIIEDEGSFSLGDSIGIDSLISDSMEYDEEEEEYVWMKDNVQHLYLRDSMLDPGYYGFAITNQSDFDWDYGFSFDITAVPEPSAIIILLFGLLLLCRRRTA